MWTPTCLALSSTSFPVARIGMGFAMWSTKVSSNLKIEIGASAHEAATDAYISWHLYEG
uniref:Uncharacterized protein n=1 Tax=Oryza brachyantha TaxID=4533 RepID=J3MVX0_ORYBR